MLYCLRYSKLYVHQRESVQLPEVRLYKILTNNHSYLRLWKGQSTLFHKKALGPSWLLLRFATIPRLKWYVVVCGALKTYAYINTYYSQIRLLRESKIFTWLSTAGLETQWSLKDENIKYQTFRLLGSLRGSCLPSLSSAETPAGYSNKNSNNQKTASSLSPSHRPPRTFFFPPLVSQSVPTTQRGEAGQLYK